MCIMYHDLIAMLQLAQLVEHRWSGIMVKMTGNDRISSHTWLRPGREDAHPIKCFWYIHLTIGKDSYWFYERIQLDGGNNQTMWHEAIM